jgi:hypothetical protein
MIDLGKLPLEKGVHLFAKVLPGFTLFLFYDCLHHGTIAKLLSIPYLGYGSRVTLFVIVCFLCGYTLAALLSGLLTPLAGALGGVWGSFRGARHPYEDEVAPWRNEKWRLAYQRRYETSAPKSLNLVSKPIVDQLFKDARPIEPHPVDPAHAAVFAQEIYQQLNAAVEAIANDKEWRMLYDHLHSELILEKRMEAIEEIMTGLDSDLAMSAAVLLLGNL